MQKTMKIPQFIIGVDEAGRGPLAGPVVAAAIIADDSIENLAVKDSKKLSKKQREELYNHLIGNYRYAVGVVHNDIIDEINILNATKMAMKQAIDELWMVQKVKTVVDGNFIPFEDDMLECIIKGDQKVKAISAASIIAKVYRDNLMDNLDKQYSMYGWVKNSGYGTKLHLEAIQKYGACKFHRKSFIKKYI